MFETINSTIQSAKTLRMRKSLWWFHIGYLLKITVEKKLFFKVIKLQIMSNNQGTMILNEGYFSLESNVSVNTIRLSEAAGN